MQVRLKGIQRINKIGANGRPKTYYYLRGAGPIKPLPGDEALPFRPGSVAFLRSYNYLISRPKRSSSTAKLATLASLLTDYRTSSRFAGLKERTQQDYLVHIDRILAKWSTLPIAALNDVGIRPLLLRWRDELSKSSRRQADMTMTVFGTILNWALDQGRVAHNYAAKPGRTYTVDRSNMIWLPEQLTKILESSPPALKLAVIIGLHTGQRRGDILRLRWQHVSEGRLRFQQSKRGRKIDLPLTTALTNLLAAERSRSNAIGDDDHIILTAKGTPWTESGFQTMWRRAMKKAGLNETGLHFHDLRGTTCTLLADAGCSDDEIGAILGWKREYVSHMRAIYQSANKGAANTGIAKLEKALDAKEV